ncbi:hypothetical protein JK154_03305 [Citrobacter sp. JGM124]|nr:hypothetical protein [Citrobacter sp. JGM124]
MAIILARRKVPLIFVILSAAVVTASLRFLGIPWLMPEKRTHYSLSDNRSSGLCKGATMHIATTPVNAFQDTDKTFNHF